MKTNQITTFILLCLMSAFTFGQSKTLDTTLNWTGKAAFNAYALSGTLKLLCYLIIL